ncbi:MAG: hypothetical protein IKI57_05215 [Clostridia bacterium]|nr:hypothetical protein [Clostridia bacterium]
MRKTVSICILEDMKRNVKGFNPKDYEPDYSHMTDLEVIDFLRDYYDRHLPVDAKAWVRINDDIGKVPQGESIGEQATFIDHICWMMTTSQVTRNTPMVIALYQSSSGKKPIYQFEIKAVGIKVIIKADDSWLISIDSPKPLDYDFMELFDPYYKECPLTIHDIPKEYAYDSFAENKSKFTIEINTQYNVYTFFYLLKHYLNIRKLMRVCL